MARASSVAARGVSSANSSRLEAGTRQRAVEAPRRLASKLGGPRYESTRSCQAWGKLLRKAGREEQALDVLERESELELSAAPAAANAGR